MTSRFRNSATSGQGNEPAQVITGRIININMNNWTVDVRAQFERRSYYNIQVASPYVHYTRGEGIYAFPEVAATCTVTIPGDSSPPFVSSFLMPHEHVDTGTDDAPSGTESHGAPPKFASGASFAGGRPRPKPGDLVVRGRDGNFVILHRGGVLQIGSTELSQRIFIPLRNYMMDVSENYAHHNAGGTMLWGIQEGPSKDLPAEFMQIYRIFAGDQFADVRVRAGKVHAPIPEPTGDAGETTNLNELEIGTSKDHPIIYEVAVAKNGFDPHNGEPASLDTRKNVVLRYFFDRRGGTFLRCQGSMLVSVKKKLKMHITDEFTIDCDKNAAWTAKTGIDIDGGSYTHIKGGIVRLGGGTRPVARQGDIVTMVVPLIQFTGTIMGAPATGAMTFSTPIYGTILSGASNVFA